MRDEGFDFIRHLSSFIDVVGLASLVPPYI
jgi:hypothetical protein